MNTNTRSRVLSLVIFTFVATSLAIAAPPTINLAVTLKTTAEPHQGSRTVPAIDPAAATGTKTILVILLQFTDKAPAPSKTPSYYNNLLFNLANETSMASYYKQNSYGRLTLTGTVTSWLTSSRTMSYYGADSGAFPNIDDENGNIFELAREAVQLADPSINYANFDQNSDGYVDNLVIIHAGNGQESSGSPNDIWSHQWEIQPAQTTGDSGKRAREYALFAENSPVGVIAHEFGHVLGLPDMYDYTYSGQVFVGSWALMDAGSWNGNPAGTRPSHMMSWSKLKLGFINTSVQECAVIDINELETVTIIPTHLQTKPSGAVRVAVIPISPGVYYTVEVRNNSALATNPFDRALPDSGVLITLCNDSATDEVFYGRPGVCVVQNAKPTDPSNDHAPFDIGIGEDPEFIDPARNVKVRILSKDTTNGAYTVEISHIQLRVHWFYVNASDTWRTYEGQTYDLTISLENTGTTGLSSVSALLIAPPAGVDSLPVSTVSYGMMMPNSISNGSANFRVQNSLTITGTPLNFTLNVTFNGGVKASLPLQVPVHKESVLPTVAIQSPATNGTSYEASEPIPLVAAASDAGGILKVWYRYTAGAMTSQWAEMEHNGTKAAVVATIQSLGMVFVTVRAMDTSGNVAQDTVTVVIIDTTPPSLLLSVNTASGDPSHFIVLGETLDIVAVAIDNNVVDQVELSINGGEFFSLLPYATTVNMGINGTLDGYAYPWTPTIEGDQLIKLRARDASGNEASVEWTVTTISQQTITTIIIVIAVIIVIFAVISQFTRRRSYRYSPARYRYRY